MAARIASLVPSLTETLFSLGLGSQLIARTGFCIHPADLVAKVPKVGGTKTANIAKLAKLQPSHVLLNRDENTLATRDALAALPSAPQLITTHPLTVADNRAVFQELGAIFEAQTAAQALCQQFDAALAAVQAQPFPQRRVLYLIWQDPWMTVARNTYSADMLALFGLHTYPASTGEVVGASRYPSIAGVPALIAQERIDCVLLASEPYAFTPQHCADLTAQWGLPVHLIDGEYISWYGSRVLMALPALAAWVKGLP